MKYIICIFVAGFAFLSFEHFFSSFLILYIYTIYIFIFSIIFFFTIIFIDNTNIFFIIF